MNIDRDAIRTGIPLIDSQHEHYIDLVDDLFALCEKTNIGQEVFDEKLGEVFTFAVEHFDAEEALMLSMQYPDYENHREQHEGFKNQIDRLSALRKDENSPDDLIIQLAKWLVEWFISQTLVHDKKMAAFLNEHRADQNKKENQL